MKYFLVAGEASGDLHGSGVMSALREIDSEADFAFMGGPKMRQVGGRCILAAEEMSYMGIIDVIRHYPQIKRGRDVVREAIRSFRPDVVICIDYGTFCMRYILPFVKSEIPATKIVYFIPPKVWAWKEFRVRQLRRDCDLIQCIFPFEIPYFRSKGVDRVSYVGNPTYEQVMSYRRSYPDQRSEGDHIAILCGSRVSEIKMNLPLMLRSIASLEQDYPVVIAGVRSISPELYSELIAPYMDRLQVEVQYGTYEILSRARAALVTSGTATLETALLGTPQVVCYATRAGHLVNFAFDHFFKIHFISLVNLIAGREVVPELFGAKCRVPSVREQLLPLLEKTTERQQMIEGYDEVRRSLYTEEPASMTAAREVLALAQE